VLDDLQWFGRWTLQHKMVHVALDFSCVVFVDRWLSFCPFSFGHCVVSPCQVYGFWLSLWYLQTFHVLFDIVLSVLLRFTAFDYPFGIFKLFPLTRTGFREFLPSGFDVWFLCIPHKDRVDIITGKTNDTTPSEQLQNQIGYSLKGKTNRDPSHTNAMICFSCYYIYSVFMWYT
jgi:hypothetical protein